MLIPFLLLLLAYCLTKVVAYSLVYRPSLADIIDVYAPNVPDMAR